MEDVHAAQWIQKRKMILGSSLLPESKWRQVHRGSNVVEQLPKEQHAAAGMYHVQPREGAAATRESGDEARRYLPQSAKSVRKGMPEMLALTRFDSPDDLLMSFTSMNIMESVKSMIARASRSVRHWRNASMGLRWTAADMLIAQRGFRRINGHIHLPKLANAIDRICEERTGRKSRRWLSAGKRRASRVA